MKLISNYCGRVSTALKSQIQIIDSSHHYCEEMRKCRLKKSKWLPLAEYAVVKVLD